LQTYWQIETYSTQTHKREAVGKLYQSVEQLFQNSKILAITIQK
jgi:hypothetical protein